MTTTAREDSKAFPGHAAVSRRELLRRVAAGAVLLPLAAGLTPACRRQGEGSDVDAPRVVIYVSADDLIAREVLVACAADLGVRIDPVFDTEATKTTGLENRIRAERGRPRADLFWSSEGFSPARLAAEGLAEPLPASLVADHPARWTDPGGRWLGFGARARVIVTNVASDVEPFRFWSELATRPKSSLPGGIAIADPRFGTTRGHLAALEDAWERARAAGADAPRLDDWLEGMRECGVRVLPGGNAATVEVVATGECACGLTDTDDALVAIARGLPIRMHVPRSLPEGIAGGGTMLVPNAAVLVKGGPGDPSAAVRVLAWLASAKGEAILCRSASRNLPIVSDASEVALWSPACEAAFAEPDPLAFDLAAAASRAESTAVRALGVLGGGGGAKG